jgi:2'-5' RNA ligase
VAIKVHPKEMFFFVDFPEALRKKYLKTSADLNLPKADGLLDHVTLLYIPYEHKQDFTPEEIEDIKSMASSVAGAFKPIKAKVQGWAYFDGAIGPGDKPATALVALIDAPGLADVHVALKTAISSLGYPANDQTHGFTPHTTFAYLEPGARVDLPMFKGDEMDIGHINLVIDKVYKIPLGEGAMAKTDKLLAVLDEVAEGLESRDATKLAAEADLVSAGISIAMSLDQYESFEDAKQRLGGKYLGKGTKVWFFKDKYGRDFGMGSEFLLKQGLPLPDPKNIKKTHVLIGEIGERNPNRVYEMMQGENWSPRAEAKELIKKSGTWHTSMSIGDVIQVGNKFYMVDGFGNSGYFDLVAMQPAKG